MASLNQKIHDTIYGVTIGDALGNPVQFEPRDEVQKNPLTDMVGGGAYRKPAGSWTDDTSMTLCLLDSLAQKGTLDYDHVMENFVQWLFKNKYTPNCRAYDVGQTCSSAIFSYKHEIPAIECGGYDEYSNGNGSLMRISPIVFYIYKQFGDNAFDSDNAFEIVHNTSALTHAHPRAKLGCSIYVAMLMEILKGTEKEKLIPTVFEKVEKYISKYPEFQNEMKYYKLIMDKDFTERPQDSIRSSGYVVDTLEAALWCFFTTDSFGQCCLKAVNLGHDADTVGAVVGGLAGLYYGMENENGIPKSWYEKIINRELIDKILEDFYKHFGD